MRGEGSGFAISARRGGAICEGRAGIELAHRPTPLETRRNPQSRVGRFTLRDPACLGKAAPRKATEILPFLGLWAGGPVECWKIECT
jgi:hypothetical protein